MITRGIEDVFWVRRSWHGDLSFLNGEPFGRSIFLSAFQIKYFDYGSLQTILWTLSTSDRLSLLEKCIVSSCNLRGIITRCLELWSLMLSKIELNSERCSISRSTTHRSQVHAPLWVWNSDGHSNTPKKGITWLTFVPWMTANFRKRYQIPLDPLFIPFYDDKHSWISSTESLGLTPPLRCYLAF